MARAGSPAIEALANILGQLPNAYPLIRFAFRVETIRGAAQRFVQEISKGGTLFLFPDQGNLAARTAAQDRESKAAIAMPLFQDVLQPIGNIIGENAQARIGKRPGVNDQQLAAYRATFHAAEDIFERQPGLRLIGLSVGRE